MARSAPPGSLRRSMRGASLLEALVSVLVLSFGVLGAVGMHTATLKANKEARNQSQALRYARELSEMMRANPAIARQTATGANPYLMDRYSPDTDTPPEVTGRCDTRSCDAGTLAQFDIDVWRSTIADVAAGGLPGVVVTVCFDTAPYDDSGLPRWDCSGTPQTGAMPVIKMAWNRVATAQNRNADGTGVELGNGKNGRPLLVMPVPLS